MASSLPCASVSQLLYRRRMCRASGSIPCASNMVHCSISPDEPEQRPDSAPTWRLLLASSFVTAASLFVPLTATANTSSGTSSTVGTASRKGRTIVSIPVPATDPTLENLSSVSTPLATPTHQPEKEKTSVEKFKKSDEAEKVTPPRVKANAFVRHAAATVGPCVVRIDVDFDESDYGQQYALTTNQENARNDESLDRKRVPVSRNNNIETKTKNAKKNASHGQGCGLVFDSTEGLVVTNAHVIKNRDAVRVTFTDGRSCVGEVVGVDALTDIALVKVHTQDAGLLSNSDGSTPPHPNTPPLPPSPLLGDSDTLEVGDWVTAVGNPFGLDNTVTLGIVSNLKRTSAELGIPNRRVAFLQTDCAINPGNSGGPLVNEFGEVVAMNTAIRADASGIGFAIPINEVKKVIDVLVTGKNVHHPHVGVRMINIGSGEDDRNLDGKESSSNGKKGFELFRGMRKNSEGTGTDKGSSTNTNRGVLIVEVFPNSPAHKAGVKPGDVCVEMDGFVVSAASEIRDAVENSHGATLNLTVLRNGRRVEVNMCAVDCATGAGVPAGEEEGRHGDTGDGTSVNENESSTSSTEPSIFSEPKEEHWDGVVQERAELHGRAEHAQSMKNDQQNEDVGRAPTSNA